MMKYTRLMAAAAVVLCSLCATAQIKRGDVTGDGNVDIADVNEVINLMLGKVASDVQTFTVNGVSFNMVEVQGGTFMMGATEEQGEIGDSGLPVHQVTLSGFSIAQTEVTQLLWMAVMGNNPSLCNGVQYGFDNGVDVLRPVECVSWDDCQVFIAKLNELTGQNFRLPTEAEWEFAARGGNKTQGYRYAGSNTADDVAWYEDNSELLTHRVGTKAPNELGLYDMSGNVFEWCQDWYGDYSAEPQVNPTGPDSGTYRVVRGGEASWKEVLLRSSSRSNCEPESTGGDSFVGLRLAL
ncbi:MAG: SUMF1/EgtB/PvdO family nonheme iron enzyme [Muribaculaceae bacterium]|nr:SUMF1/EgtB/PvdO family nonheme iron enzyme [Muribaculaceae bacterium]